MLRKEKSEFAALRKSLRSPSIQEANAYQTLLRAFLNFHSKLIDYSTRSCAGGTGCGVYSAMDEVHDNRNFLAIVEELKEGGFPAYTALDLSAGDDSLNNIYQADLKDRACPEVMIDEIRPCDKDLRRVSRPVLRAPRGETPPGRLSQPQTWKQSNIQSAEHSICDLADISGQ
jgi:hypothetical protein